MQSPNIKFKLIRYFLQTKAFFTAPRYRNKMRLTVILSLSVCFLAALIWWRYANQTSIWRLIPDEAVLVIETNQIKHSWKKLDSSLVWTNLRQIPYFDSLAVKGKKMELGLSEEIANVFENKTFAASLHQISKDNFDFVLYLPIPANSSEVIQNYIAAENQKEGRLIEKRMYSDFEIHDVKSIQKLQLSFSYIFYKNYMIASYTPYLVEDVIRKITQSENESFFKENKNLFEEKKTENEDAHLYVNIAKLFSVSSAIYEGKNQTVVPELKALASRVKLNLTDKDAYFSGNVFVAQNQWLTAFDNQKASEFADLQKYLPIKTAIFYRLGFSAPQDYFKKQRSFAKENQPITYGAIEKFETKYNFPFADFIGTIKDEIAFAEMEMQNKTADRLIFVRLENATLAQEILAELAKKSNNGKIVADDYQSWKITSLPIAEFPSLVFGTLFSGFNESFFTVIDNKYLLIGNNIQAVKDLSNAILEEETWEKSIKYHQLIKKTDAKSNFMMIADVPRFWNELNTNLAPSWKTTFDANKNTFLRFESIAAQFTYEEEDIYHSNLILTLHSSVIKKQVQDFVSKQKTSFETTILRPCDIVKNHTDKSEEIFIQDSQNQIHLVSKEGKIIWTRQIDSKIEGKVQQIDLFKNGKLQYLFASKNNIYAFDRLGRVVENFPIEIPEDFQTDIFSLIYNEKTREYRFIIADSGGTLVMFDQNGQVVSDWKRVILGESLAAEINFAQIGSYEYYLIVHKNGFINLLDKNGKSYKGFPLRVQDAVFSNPALLEVGVNVHSSSFSLFSDNGEIIRFSLEGKVIRRTPLSNSEGNFTFCTDMLKQRSGIIVRQDKQKVFFMGSNGQLLFEKIFSNETVKTINYYNFGAHNEMICVFDPIEKNTFIFNRSGELINRKPIRSEQIARISFDEIEKRYQLYRILNNDLYLHYFAN